MSQIEKSELDFWGNKTFYSLVDGQGRWRYLPGADQPLVHCPVIICKLIVNRTLLFFSGNPRKTRTQWTSWSAWSQGKLILFLCLYFTFWKRYSINSLFTKYNFNMSHYFSIDFKLMIQHIFLRVLLVIEDHLDQEVFLVDRYLFLFLSNKKE